MTSFNNDPANARAPFEDICEHVERAIISRRETFQPYGVFMDRGTWYAAPLWWINESGLKAARIWKPAI